MKFPSNLLSTLSYYDRSFAIDAWLRFKEMRRLAHTEARNGRNVSVGEYRQWAMNALANVRYWAERAKNNG